MERKFRFLIFSALLISPIAANGQFRPAKCEVQPLWVGGGVRSANFGLMGTFETKGSERKLIRSFRLADTNLIATVGIVLGTGYVKGKEILYRIRLAITVSDKEQERIFESVDSSEASTIYAKKWNLSVTKNINFDDRIYMFTLRCWDLRSFGTQRPFW